MAVAALILGICSIVFDFIFQWLGILLGVVGIIMGAVARSKTPENGMATGGLVCSIIGTILGIVTLVACVACVGGLAALS